MFTSVTVERLYSGSVYKLIGIGLTCSVVPLSLLMGVLALFGASTVTWNDRPIMGMWGLAFSPLIGILVTLLLTFIVGTACVAGLWIYSKFRPLVLWGKDFASMTPVQANSRFGPA
jgi:hypothetical protein